MMQVELVNDGPVTVIIDSHNRDNSAVDGGAAAEGLVDLEHGDQAHTPA